MKLKFPSCLHSARNGRLFRQSSHSQRYVYQCTRRVTSVLYQKIGAELFNTGRKESCANGEKGVEETLTEFQGTISRHSNILDHCILELKKT